MNAELKWLEGAPGAPAHLCVINRDDSPQPKCAAICNTRAALTWKVARPESSRCATCLNMEASEKSIVFVIPDTGNRITVREGKK